MKGFGCVSKNVNDQFRAFKKTECWHTEADNNKYMRGILRSFQESLYNSQIFR